MRGKGKGGGELQWEGSHEPLYNFTGALHGFRLLQSQRCDVVTGLFLALFAAIFFICVYHQFKPQHKACLDYLHLDLLLHPHSELLHPHSELLHSASMAVTPDEGPWGGRAGDRATRRGRDGVTLEKRAGGAQGRWRSTTPNLQLIAEELGGILGMEEGDKGDPLDWEDAVLLLEDLQEALFSSPFRSVWEGENVDEYNNDEGYRLMQFTGKACVQLLRELQNDVRKAMRGKNAGDGVKQRILSDAKRVTSAMPVDTGDVVSNNTRLGVDRGQPLEGKPVLFVHGHAGSFTQAKPFGSQLLATEVLERTGEFDRREGLLWRDEELPEKPLARDAELLPSRVDLFSTDFKGQWSVMHGTYLQKQAEFVVHCVEWILQQYSHLPEADRPRKVLIIGHSMGGIVTRYALMQMVRESGHALDPVDELSFAMGEASNAQPGQGWTPPSVVLPVDTVITIGTPHLLPPFPLDQTTTVLYRELNRFWAANKDGALRDVTLASISGGLLDSNVVSELSEIPSSMARSDRVVYAISENIPFVWRGIPHVWLVRGRHLLDVVVRMTLEVLDGDAGPEERVRIFYDRLHDRLALQLGHCKHHYRHWLGTPAMAGPETAGTDATMLARHPTWVLSDSRYNGLAHDHAVLRELVKEQPVRLGAFHRTPVMSLGTHASNQLQDALDCKFVQRFSGVGCQRLGSMENKCTPIPAREESGEGHTFTFVTDMEPGVDFQLELLHVTILDVGIVGVTYDCAPVPISGGSGCMIHLDQAELEKFQFIKLTFLPRNVEPDQAKDVRWSGNIHGTVSDLPSVWLEKSCVFSGGFELETALVEEIHSLPAMVTSSNRRAMEIVLNPLVAKFFPIFIELQAVAPVRRDVIPPVIFQIVESGTSCGGSYKPLLYHYKVPTELQWYTYLHQTSPLLTTPRVYLFLDPRQGYTLTLSRSVPAAVFQMTLDYARVGVPLLLVVALFTMSTVMDEYHSTAEMPHFLSALAMSFRMLVLPVVAFVVLYGIVVTSLGDSSSPGQAPVEFHEDGIVDEDFIWHTFLYMPPFVPFTAMTTATGLLATMLLVLLGPLMAVVFVNRLVKGNEQSAVALTVLGKWGMRVWAVAIGSLGVLHLPLAIFIQWLFSMAILLIGSVKGLDRSWEHYQFNVLCIITAVVWFKLSCIFVALTHPFAAHWFDRDTPALLAVLALSVISQTSMIPKTILTARYSGLILKLCAVYTLLSSGHHHYVAIDGIGLACAYLALVHAFGSTTAVGNNGTGRSVKKDDKHN